MMEYIKGWLRIFNDREQLALTVIVLLHLALVVPLAAVLNLWIDEVYTLQSTGGGLVHAVQRALDFEFQPPLYFVLITLWRTLNDSYFFARIFSIVCTASTVVLTAGLARRYLQGVPPFFASAIIAFNPLTVFLAVNVRFYALALLLSALLLRFFYDGYLAQDSSSATARRYFLVVAVLGLYTHYFLGFLLVGGAVVLFSLRQFEELRWYISGMMITAVLFLPLAVITTQQVATVAGTTVSRQQPLLAGAAQVWKAVWHYLLPVNQDTALAVVRAWISRLAGPFLLLAVLARRRWPPVPLLATLAIAAVVGLFFLGVSMRLGSDFMRPEHPTVFFLPVMLAAVGLLHYTGGIRLVAVGVTASVIFSGIYLLQTYASLAKMGDWIRVSGYIQQYESPSEPILVFKAEFVLAFAHHYSGRNSLIPLPKPTSRERYDLIEQVLRSESEITHALSGRLGPTGRFWLVTIQTQPFRGVDFKPEILEKFIANYCKVIHDQLFNGSRVRLLELRPEGRQYD